MTRATQVACPDVPARCSGRLGDAASVAHVGAAEPLQRNRQIANADIAPRCGTILASPTVVPVIAPPAGVLGSLQENETAMPETRVLIADSNIASANLLRDILARAKYLCTVAPNPERALDVVKRRKCDIAICDVQMEGTRRYEMIEGMKKLRPELPIIVGADRYSMVDAVAAAKSGAFQYMEKPFDIGDLLGFIVNAVTDADRHRTPTLTPRTGSVPPSCDLAHESAIMLELVESIALVARSNAPVLILGESGTGKDRVARAIHAQGPRASQPFVAVNTAAVPEPLLESELFGHVKGAFTGATLARRGLLAEADGGTLLLDEIADLPMILQPKLLRVLQFGESRAVGSDKCGYVDVRVIAATHRDLNRLVEEGRFRDDLRYRLNVISIVVPPLRHRRQDILPLVAQFLAEARNRNKASPVRSFDDEALGVLMGATWPGNVRELENAIERIVVLGREGVVTVSDLRLAQEQPNRDSWNGFGGTPSTLKEMNLQYLDWVLKRTEGDKARAAAILDIDLSTLYRWVRARH